MSALLTGHAASLAALGLALLLALAAGLAHGRARKVSPGRNERLRARTVMDERIRTRLEAMIWPD